MSHIGLRTAPTHGILVGGQITQNSPEALSPAKFPLDFDDVQVVADDDLAREIRGIEVRLDARQMVGQHHL